MGVERHGASKGALIIVVDDEACCRRMLQRHLGPADDIAYLQSLTDARAAMDSSAAIVGAVIDIHLGDGDGALLIGELRERVPGAGVLLMTGDLDLAQANRAVALGAGIVYKLDDLHQALEQFTHQLRATPLYRAHRTANDIRLSPKERQALVSLTLGVPRSRLPSVVGHSSRTSRATLHNIENKASKAGGVPASIDGLLSAIHALEPTLMGDVAARPH
jgi:ActR/RegA family two-component response regulator